jgi:hypothetical protein
MIRLNTLLLVIGLCALTSGCTLSTGQSAQAGQSAGTASSPVQGGGPDNSVSVGVPGPIAGAGIPAAAGLGGYVWYRRRRSRLGLPSTKKN